MISIKIKATAIGLILCSVVLGQQAKNFIPVQGETLKAKLDSAIVAGKANAPLGRFWVGYQFEVRPAVTIDFDQIDDSGNVYVLTDEPWNPNYSPNPTRELGMFLLFDEQLDQFIRAEVYNLRRKREYSSYPVYWAGRIGNEESLNYLKSIIDSPAPDLKRLAERAVFAIALHDDARVDAMLLELIRRPIAEPMRSRALYWLGFTPETQTKTTFLTELVRNTQETREARQQAMFALSMGRSAGLLPLFQNLFETIPSRERDLRGGVLPGIARNDNTDAALAYLTRVMDTEKDFELRRIAIAMLRHIPGPKGLSVLTNIVDGDKEIELQKQAVVVISRHPRDAAVPILIRIAGNHPKMAVRKVAVQMLGQTGDARAAAFLKELLSKD